MRKTLLGSLTALCVSAGLASAAEPETKPAPPPIVVEPGIPAAPGMIPDHPATAAPSRPMWGRLPGPHDAPVVAGQPSGSPMTEGPVLDEPTFDEGGSFPSYGRFYLRAEYLLWWLKRDHVPPLVTTGPATIPTGLLGSPTTTILSSSSLGNDSYSGVRLTAGFWLDDCQSCGIELGGFILGRRDNNHTFNNPVLARPFFNLNTGMQDSEVASFPGVSTGTISVNNRTNFGGFNTDVRHKLCCSCWYRVDLLAGFRYLNLDEQLTITEQGVDTNSPLLQPALRGATFVNIDSFHARNQFYGGEVGLEAEFRRGNFFVDVRGKIALGDTQETLEINGIQRVAGPAGVFVARGGLLAEPSNIGRYTRDSFSVVPEVGLDVGYQVTDNFRVFVGYSFLYWSRVLRPGQQIDTAIDVSQIPFGPGGVAPTGLNRPAALLKQTDFWAQGINVGAEFRY